MNKDEKNYWYNFVNKEHEYIETPLDFSNYVPQIGGRGLYQLYVQQGMKPIDAAIKVLSISVGKEE